MGLTDDYENETMLHKYTELCADLNMDKMTTEEAWQSFENISQNYTLEGNKMHWLCCALYVACRRSHVPAVGQRGLIEGNCVSLTRLLRMCNLSIIQFFEKAKKWADMANLPEEFRNRLDKVERNFAVAHILYKKYEALFAEIFTMPLDGGTRSHRSRKQKRPPCTSAELFDFTWTLFSLVRASYPSVSDDLVNSFHLLLCTLDLLLSNVIVLDRRDLLNPNFPGLPSSFNKPYYTPPIDAVCNIAILCGMTDGIVVEAKSIKEHFLYPKVKEFYEKGKIRLDPTAFIGLLEQVNFDMNYKNIGKMYEEYVLSEGDFDERVFLGEKDMSSDLFTPSKQTYDSVSEESQRLIAKKNLSHQFENFHPQSLVPPTPLTGRYYLKSKEPSFDDTPVSTATHCVSRLQALLAGRKAEPSDTLLAILQNCSLDLKHSIMYRISELGERFVAKYIEGEDMTSAQSVMIAQQRRQLAETLYYRALESICEEESKRIDEKNLGAVLTQDLIHRNLFACCLDIVLFSYNTTKTFPWILDALQLEAYGFYRIIEVLIRAEDQLSRDIVKHLNHIEEMVLESMAWKWESPLWDSIKTSRLPIPYCEQVSPRTLIKAPEEPNTRSDTNLLNMQLLTMSPNVAKHPVVKLEDQGGNALDQKRNNAKNRNSSAGASSTLKTVSDENEGKRPASLALFFRKFYNLAAVRIEELCNWLKLSKDVAVKIWTCFEHVIVRYHDMMRDRHLDQILMCTIYVICKVSKLDVSFTEIMRCYRSQPHSSSHVYRSVLLSSRERPGSGARATSTSPNQAEGNEDSNTSAGPRDNTAGVRSSSTIPFAPSGSCPPTPTQMAGTATVYPGEERGDLIKFYNTVYVKLVQDYAVKFSTPGPNSKVIEDFIVEAYTKRYGGIKEEVRNRATVIYAIAVAIFAVGGMIGGFGGGILANKLGRKRGLLLNNLMGIAGACLMGFCKYPNSYEMLIIGRFIIGFYCGLNTSLVPMYISEIAPLTLRGGLGTVNQLGVTIGLLVSQVLGIQQLLGNPEGWHLLLGITLCPAILQLVLFSFCPESPRHLLITKNREEEARKALRRLRASHHIEADIEEMKAEERAEQAEARTTLCQLIRTTSLRNPLVIAIVMQLSQQLSGINAVFYYSTVLFKNAGLSEEAAKYATTGIGVIMVTMTLISIPLMDKAGRRTLHLWGLGGMFIFSIFITISLLVKELIQWVTYLSVVSVLLFVVFFAVGPGSIPWMITAELFSQGPRPAAMSLAVLVNWMANFLVGIGFPALNAGLSSYVFLPFSILLAFFWVFTYRKVPETRNKTFEEIAAIFKSREDRMAQMQHLSTLAPPSAQENTALLAEEKFPKDGPRKTL
ncbi:hypothetical protein QYM36_002436 [Artemia franciscana]|uniref:Major facilitator superfamily (MFS) profile domain-containing protein n=1 Tax=Artemia franciscana TaxID=6661 RepID=A0AA88IBF6_ARTSF|nr:hypothetical protein QYM36_002436 [Artemia franciscana]KAK2724089.1 hypothetical protein QYM36_002436 [Artemia franciscana]